MNVSSTVPRLKDIDFLERFGQLPDSEAVCACGSIFCVCSNLHSSRELRDAATRYSVVVR